MKPLSATIMQECQRELILMGIDIKYRTGSLSLNRIEMQPHHERNFFIRHEGENDRMVLDLNDNGIILRSNYRLSFENEETRHNARDANFYLTYFGNDLIYIGESGSRYRLSSGFLNGINTGRGHICANELFFYVFQNDIRELHGIENDFSISINNKLTTLANDFYDPQLIFSIDYFTIESTNVDIKRGAELLESFALRYFIRNDSTHDLPRFNNKYIKPSAI